MARNPLRIPSYRRHKASGQAVVTLNEKDHYLGPYGSRASKTLYDKIVGEWQANGRRLPGEERGGITVKELVLAFWKWAGGYYVKNGKPTSQLGLIKRSLKPLRETYGNEAAADFTPLKFKALRETLIAKGYTRGTINESMGRVKRAFGWGVTEGLVAETTYAALRLVPGLKQGRGHSAPDRPPVGPVDPAHVEAILKVVKPQIAAMIRLQDLTGMRPGEVCSLRPCELDKTAEVWIYRPKWHKTSHRSKTRVIPIGPKAREVLQPWLDAAPDPETCVFRPKPQRSNGARREKRKERAPGYTSSSYGNLIRQACLRAGVPRWAANQLRHSAATRIRQAHGLEGAQVVLGHADITMTQIYAERDLKRACDIAKELG